ncbi:Phage head-tail joining protein [Paracoccus isoporae]|uniref:Phage head-tail joining protein n=1 Tax=Paracoccus isoporae TaxID=591205 RepID=A0A1G7EW82_9RHOB|nr:head-tail adaptor protein [Paracoccus isoporae]SDE67871.1 Phage head-tail joining protein [Paracoccus isoporae]
MAVPRLNVPLTLETAEREPDGMGGQRLVWRALGVVYAQMLSGAGRLRGAQAGAESRLAWRIILRAAPPGDPRRPAPGQRLRSGARLFRIDAVAEDGPDGRYLRINAVEEPA